MTYLLDADVFIQAKNRHYGFDFCPGFWDWVDTAHATRTVVSIDRVRIELLGVADELSEWARARPESFFPEPDAAVIPSLRATSLWANSGEYEPSAVATFLGAADFYLVAHAHAHQKTVVTHEVVSSSVRKIKIPDACIALGVRCVTPFAMLRAEGARLVLG